MMGADGDWAVSVATPMGEQQGTFTVAVNGERFDGILTNPLMGELATADGRVNGDVLTWRMEMTRPMAAKLDCTATVAGDAISGTVKAGFFGTFKLSGTRL
jgi:hypothetical protein